MRHARQTDARAEASKAISSGCDPDRLRWFMIAAAVLAAVRRDMRNRIMASGVLTMALVPAPALAQARPWEREWAMHPGMWGPGGLVMMPMMLLFWGLVITGIVLALRWSVRQSRREQPDRALDILRERYARGEIDEEEFEGKRRDLGGRALRAE